ncbi:hypothetical protein Tco_1096655, partial [Tanacetum coccineum]
WCGEGGWRGDEDDEDRGGVEREKGVCRLLAGVGMAGKYGREIERERDGG